ncbi:hypothetical protein AB0O95_01425 [Rhodoglobus sp. NPDC076762]
MVDKSRFSEQVRRILGVLVVGILVAGASVVASVPERAEAVVGSEFNPGYIISDEVFFDDDSLTEAQVQAFLVQMVPSCVGANGYPCLRDYSVATYDRPNAGPGHCSPYTGAASESASRIIVKVAQACGISPKVLLVMLQKEQGLVTKTSPSYWSYQAAMGYGCPDTAACDSKYYGFYNQVYNAAWQLRQYTLKPNSWNYRIGNVAIQYHPNAACGSSNVNILNQATANLYIYTPYQPNASALANLGGVGDACGSYGNRNFWVYFNNWFGSPIGLVNPLGSLDSAVGVTGGARVFGWAFDPDTTDPVQVHVYVNGSYNSSVTANKTRSDLGSVYPGRVEHGFLDVIPLSPGSKSVCLYAINVGLGSVNTPLGCKSVTVPALPTPPVVEPAATESGAVYRFWSDTYNGHFYTRSVAERNNIIAKYPGVWKYETVAFGAFGTAVEGTVPVYRFWSSTYNGHFYTTSESEKNQIIATYPSHIWKYETIAYYVYPSNSTVADTTPISRFWSGSYGHHFYTSSEAEALRVRQNYPLIWAYEGQVFRVLSAKPAAAPLP